MPWNIDLMTLRFQRDSIGASGVESTWILHPPEDNIDYELRGGIEVSDSGELTIFPTRYGELLGYKGRQILLYIQDHGWNVGATIADGLKGRRFHVAHCSTLRQMIEEDRFERYVITNNMSKDFYITGVSIDGSGKGLDGYAKLRVCKNCLSEINYKNYRWNRYNTVFSNFDIEEFFQEYESIFPKKPSRWAGSNDGQYTKDWEKVSKRYRRSVNFVCEGCHLNLEQYERLLHVHHINGNKTDNRTSNLMALCAECHSEQPGHTHMRVAPRDKQLIEELRRQQGLVDA